MTQADYGIRWHIFDLLCNQETTITSGGYKDILETCKEYPDLFDIESHYPTTTIKVKPEGRVYIRNLCRLFDERDIKPEHMKIAQKTITRKAAA